MTLNDRFDIPASVVARQLSGETVVLDLEGGIYFGLNAVGSRIWQLIEEGKSLGEITTQLTEEYDVVPDLAERDTLALAHDLLSRRLVVPA